MKNRWIHITFWVILLLGFLVRLYKIGNPIADWHSFRQADTASVTRFFVEKGVDMFKPRYHDISRVQSGLFNPNGYRFVEFPIYNLIHAVFYKTMPFISLEVWGRLVSIFAALGSSVLIFYIAKKYISLFGGMIAMAFYLLLPYNIYFTRVILPEPLAIFFGLLFLALFIKFLDSSDYSKLYFSCLALAVSILIKPYTIFFGIPALILIHEKYSLTKIYRKKEYLFATLIVLLPFFVWRLWMNQFPEGIPFWKWTFNGDGIRFKPAFWYWIFGERLTKLILGFWGLFPFVIGLLSLDKKTKIFHYFMLAMFLFVCVFATANVKHDYYQTIAIPAISFVFALGLERLWHAGFYNKNLTRFFAFFSVFIMLVSGAFQIKEFYKINHPEIVEAGKAVDKLTPKDSLVIAAYNGDTAFLYQTKRRGWPNVELPINELVSEGAEYYVSVNLDDSQTKEFMTKFATIQKTDKFVILDLKKGP